MKAPLEGVLVVSVEQAVAAPVCTGRLREAGARVIKVERGGGDFARGYDRVAGGDSSYFLWANLGKESAVLDFKDPDDARLLHGMLAHADVFVQNLAPGALERAGFGSRALRRKYSGLITCDITGYGSAPGLEGMKAYDLLVQAESGLISINGGKNEPGRVGVSICDINAGMNAHAGILEALLSRAQTGHGSGIEISLFGTAADLMTVPLLHNDYGDKAPARTGISHPSIAPYGGYSTRDGHTIIIAVQNEREWRRFCETVLKNPDLARDNRFDSNENRVRNRRELDMLILAVTFSNTRTDLAKLLKSGDIAYGYVNGLGELSTHPALRRRLGLSSEGIPISLPEKVILHSEIQDGGRDIPRAPAVGEHTEKIREEFA